MPDVYDVVEYPAFPYQDTHPERLATMALLHGLRPAAVERCRVLEIGCNAGVNLIPMAYSLPESKFVGFDLAGVPVAVGQDRIKALGLKNIRLLQADLMETEGEPELQGEFDYIIAHGVYTWVPEAVREGLLRFCKQHLSARGVAFISYAALPGGYARLLTRDIMQFRGAGASGWDNPNARVYEAMRFVEFIAQSRPENDGYRNLLTRELRALNKRETSVVFHDELSPAYRPVLFREFTAHAAKHGLRYFSEAEFPSPKDPCFQPETATTIQQLAEGDPLAQEQMLDFARMRQYRESLLCHAEAEFSYDLQVGALHELMMSSKAQSGEGKTPGSRVYSLSPSIQIETQHRLTATVLEYLIDHSPEAVDFPGLTAHLESGGLSTGPELIVLLLRLVVSKMIDLHAWKAPVTRLSEEKPVASGLCRQDAATQAILITPLHTVLDNKDPIVQKLIPLLDGSRNREALLRDLAAALPDVSMETLEGGIGPAMEVLSRTGVLVKQDA